MATSGGIIAPIALRAFKHVFKKTTNLIKARIAEASRPLNHELQPILARITPRQAIHPAARLRQAKGRWYTTHSTINASVRRFMSKANETASHYSRAEFPSSSTARAVSRLTTRAPFASTLRPNLTGGAFPRTAGGYSLGGGRAGGARYFSHTPAAPAQVINNVSAAVRAFWISGQQARFDGTTPQGEKRFRAVSNLQQETAQKLQGVAGLAPRAGSFIDFHVNPAITALTPLVAIIPFNTKVAQEMPNLNTGGFLDCLAVDFSRALKDLAMTMNDLKRLSTLGDLPISLESKSILRVRFPGCDAETVERLCGEIGIQRGVISQDPDYHEDPGAHLALMFPFAPQSDPSLSTPGGSLRSQIGDEDLYDDIIDDLIENPWMEGYGSTSEISEGESVYFSRPSQHADSSDFEGVEGIYRFLEQCDNSKRIS